MPRAAYDISVDRTGVVYDNNKKKANEVAVKAETVNKELRDKTKSSKKVTGGAPKKTSIDKPGSSGGNSATTTSRSGDYGRSWGELPDRKYRTILPDYSKNY